METISRRSFLGVGACAGLNVVAQGTSVNDSTFRPTQRWRGFNLLGMFKKKIPSEAYASDPKWLRTPGYFKEEEFEWIKSWGFNFVRFPLDYRILIRDDDPLKIDEEALKPLDEGIRLARERGIHVQICFHRAPGYCINKPDEKMDLFRDEKAYEACAHHWRTFTKRYQGIPSEELSFDLLNEPSHHTEQEITTTFSRLIDEIHRVDPSRLIIANGWGCGRRELKGLFNRKNVGFSMRGYDPTDLSHYHAEWWDQKDWKKPAWPPENALSGRDWIEKNIFIHWKETLRTKQFLMSNEFGCYRHTPHQIALAWLEDLLKLWKEHEIGWALWNLSGVFGVLDSCREDITYEKFHGHLLDRKMLGLLQRY